MRLHELFVDRDIIIETGGSGRIVPGVNTTPDVGANEISKQARKWGFRVTRDGVPPKSKTNGSFKKA